MIRGLLSIRRPFITSLLVLSLVSCGTLTPQVQQSDDDTSLLIVKQGSVSVKRAGRKDYIPGMFGMVLHRGDLLRLAAGAQARIACADLTLADAGSGTTGVPCKSSRPIITNPATGSRVNLARSSALSDIPVVISPRRTRLLNPLPTLRWTPMQGVDSYQVSIMQEGTLWSAEVKGKAEITYPADAPPLIPGVTYKVVVIANGRSSEDKLVPDLGFSIASPSELQELRDAEEHIKALGLANEPTQFLTAVLYATRKPEVRDNYNAEAIERLESLQVRLPEPAVLRMLGDLYLKIGVLNSAEHCYTQAVDLSRSLNDPEGLAVESRMLGMIDELLGQNQEAIGWLQAAVAQYQQLGDDDVAKQVQAEVDRLKKP